MTKLGALHLTKPTGPKHTGTVIFFHGSGGTGENMKEWVNLMVKNFTFSHIKVLFPTAPLQPYTPAGGQMSNVWFDREHISPDVPEKLDTIIAIEKEVKNILKREHDAGIPSSRIVVGGFSMGGTLSLHTGYRWDQNLAGIFVFSSFLNQNSAVYDDLRSASNNRVPPLLQIHGDSDDLVHLKWGEDTFTQLKSLGVQGDFHVMPKLGHMINKRGITLIKDWIDKLIPPDA